MLRLLVAFALGTSLLVGCRAGGQSGNPTAGVIPAAGPIQTFKVRPQIVQTNGVTFDARPDKIAFKYFALVPPAPGITRDIALGHDGNLWITTDCAGTIERLTPKGVATAYSYGIPSQCDTSTSLTPGPDGNLWFVDQLANIVGKISTRGKITKYPLPAASPCNYLPTAPIGIVAGADGALWFTVTNPGNPFCSASPGYSPAVGRITTSGAMTFYYTAPPGTSNATSPERITAGPDGNLYFIALNYQSSDQLTVGTITTGGVFSYTQGVSTYAGFDDYLTFGSDGNLWVTDNNVNHNIFRIAGSVITGFTVGKYKGVQQAAYGIATGPDGQLWFTTTDDNELGRITTAGAITFYRAPSCSPNNCGNGGGIVRRDKGVWHTLPGNREDEDVVEASSLP
ncbi:MAG: hypothetical protein JO104_06235 [Candidatus Eremiobacteraeota bacterium]|nr:hypothetical protein [Candidatus Eremiobacteraeota bacterium]